ncbi:MAG: hypothetical protein EOO59_07100, partial [Hymenobacter sp.]
MKSSIFTLLATAALLQLGTACVNTERETATSTKDPRSVYVPPSSGGRRVNGATVLNTVRASQQGAGGHYFVAQGIALSAEHDEVHEAGE